MNFKEIKDLVKLIENSEITEFSWENEGSKVTVKKGQVNLQPMAHNYNPALFTQPVTVPIHPQTPQIESKPVETKTEKADENTSTIFAPMVGTFYRAPGPDAESYVQVGQIIEPGQVLCIIEAMKLMNEIESELRGKIVKILVENAQPVEYGQPLFLIEKV